MQIKLGDKTYTASTVKARMVRRAFELIETVDIKQPRVKDIDTLTEYLVDLYGKQFTVDDVYDGLDSAELFPTIIGAIFEITGTMNNKLGQFPNAQPGK